MHLMYYMDENGKRIYTLKVCIYFLVFKWIVLLTLFQKVDPVVDKPTSSAHPGKISVTPAIEHYLSFREP